MLNGSLWRGLHPINLGLGVVVQTGYKYAIRNKFDYIVRLDSDGQHNPKYIPKAKHMDFSKAGRDLKHNPKVTPEEGIKRTVEWMKSIYTNINI